MLLAKGFRLWCNVCDRSTAAADAGRALTTGRAPWPKLDRQLLNMIPETLIFVLRFGSASTIRLRAAFVPLGRS